MLSVTVVTHERERGALGKLVALRLYWWEDETNPARTFSVQVRRDGEPLGERQFKTEAAAERRRRQIATDIDAGQDWDEIRQKHGLR